MHFLFTVSLFPLLAEVIEDLLSPSYNSGGLIGGVTQQPPIHLNKMPTLLKVTLMKKLHIFSTPWRVQTPKYKPQFKTCLQDRR